MTANRSWMIKGSCSGKALKDPVGCDKAFFPDRGRPSLIPKSHRALCASCPVTMECLDFSVAHQLEGFWGGTTKNQRDLLPSTYVLTVIHRAMREGWYEVYPPIKEITNRHAPEDVLAAEEFLFDFELEAKAELKKSSQTPLAFSTS